jgi:putative ABC transport system permease protein
VFTLLFLMTGLTEQFHREPRDTVAAFGADGWMVRDGASGAFTSAATMPSDTADEVDGATADPIVVGRHSLSHGATPVDVVIVGFTPDGLGSPELVDGRAPADAGEIAVDKAAELSVGDTTAIGDQRYTVVGRTERTTLFAGMPLVYMDIEVAQSLLYRGQPLASAILVSGEAEEIPDGFAVLEPAEIAEDATRPLERSISSVNLIRILLWFVAAMIIGTMVYLSALERRRDVAVLKAIGASTKVLGSSIALQGVMVALVAAAIAAVLQILVVPVFPLAVSVPPRALLQVPAIAVLVALAAGGVGLRKAVAIDPALAFAGAGS